MTASEFTDTSSKPNEQETDRSGSLRWTDPTRSQEIAALVGALSLAQAAIVAPERNRTVNVQPRDQSKPSYSFAYATLNRIIEVIRKPLTDNGLWFTQIMKEDSGTYILDTRLMHSSGQWIACQTPLIWDGNGGNQQFGSALTFMRRYSLTSLLGIAAEEDDDANVADGNTVNAVQDRKPTMPKADVMAPTVTDMKEWGSSAMSFKVPEDAEGKDDWVSFGKELIAAVKSAKTSDEASRWSDMNAASLTAMQQNAPRVYTNLTTSITKVINDLKQKEGKKDAV
jgi:ERF superfamily